MLVAKGYRPVDRAQQFLLPEDMGAWLPADDPVWLVIDVVASLDTSALHAQRKVGGVGRAGYDPDMLLTLLIYGWAQGQRSSRRLERLCHRDVAFRVICAGDVPDHATISRFRAASADAAEGLFTQVLLLCAKLGLADLGMVALDGVKIASNASLSASRSEDGLRKALEEEARKAAREHAETDAADDARDGGDSAGRTPPGLRDQRSRRARIEEALRDLGEANAELAREEQRAQRCRERDRNAQQRREQYHAERIEQALREPRRGPVPEAIKVEYLAAVLARHRAAQQAKIDAHTPGMCGARPKPVEQSREVIEIRRSWEKAVAEREQRQAAEQAAAEQAEAKGGARPRRTRAQIRQQGSARNITDPQSRMMPLRGGGWLQGYNCQAVTSSDGLIIATDVGNNPSDVVTFTPMLAKATAAAELIAAARADAGHLEPDTPAKPAAIGLLLADAGYLSEDNLTCDGPQRLIATGKSRAVTATAKKTPTSGPPPDDAT